MARAYTYNVGQRLGAVFTEKLDAPALIGLADGDVTYRQLDAVSHGLASILRARGITRRDVVGIVHTKTAQCYAAMVACLRIGAIYVNLDDQNPVARLTHIFAAARPKLIVGSSIPDSVAQAACNTSIPILNLTPQLHDALGAVPDRIVQSDNSTIVATDPAYIMFTSGSTGVPKGALMSHGNVLNFAAWVKERFSVTHADVFTNVNPMYFDNSVFDFYGALLNGAALAPISRETVADPGALLRAVERAGCSLWFSVPSLLMYLSTVKALTPQRLERVRTFAFGGEGYPKPELRKLFDLYSARSKIINVYGPTECTCICSAWDVTAADLDDPVGLVTLGPVTENFASVVLDETDAAVMPGGIGELGLLGPQVGLGYINDPDRTARAFTANPVTRGWHERMYRTGDLVRLGSDGRQLDFVGRKDNQIKHMGYRIELEEIEAALHRLAGISEAVVLHVASRRNMKSLIACIAAQTPYTDAELRSALAEWLPPYMIPQHFELVQTLPKNANGKVDRHAIAAQFS